MVRGVQVGSIFLRFGGVCFKIVLGSVLGSILEPVGLPNGIGFERFGGSVLGSLLGWFLGGRIGTPLKFKAGQNWRAI